MASHNEHGLDWVHQWGIRSDEGDARIQDGDEDGTATVDMGVDKFSVAASSFYVYLPLVIRGY